MSLHHGGRLREAAARYKVPVANWLDLSTGISPWSWPVPDVPPRVWQRLPEEEDDLVAIAADYYRCPAPWLLPVPGSQFAIGRLPPLMDPGTVALPAWGYREHHNAWRQSGHHCHHYRSADELTALASDGAVDYAVVINPNNPSTETLPADYLLAVSEQLQRRGGCLVVDEAFADPLPGLSLAPHCRPGLVVLRSLGKFFGLAGIRLGFVIAPPDLIARLGNRLDPWAVSHPARWIGCRALADTRWQDQQRQRLTSAGERWLHCLTAMLPELSLNGTALFVSGTGSIRDCHALYRSCARRGLLLRLFDPVDGQGMVRLGLPPETHWAQAIERLAVAIGERQ